MIDLTIKSLLVADDDMDDLVLLLSAIDLVSKNINISHVSDGAELLTFLLLKIKPELILLDINMPKVNGIDCLKSIKTLSEFRDIPIIMYSTSSNQDVIDQCYHYGASRYIVKPFRYNDIVKFMEMVLTINWKESIVVPKEEFLLSPGDLLAR